MTHGAAPRRPVVALFAAALTVGTLSGCVSSRAQTPSAAPTPATAALSTPPDTAVPTPAASPVAPSTTTRPAPAPRPPAPALPRGGRRILPDYRVVAFYGGPDGPGLGVLGSADPETIAARIESQAAAYAPYGRRIQPAMELIATVAQGSPGPYGTWSEAIPDDAIARYLAVAHRHRMLLILDFQPGRGEFLPQVRAVEPFLRDPSVSVALDPEWKLGPGEIPAREIGSSSAASINDVARYLSGIVVRDQLPDKLLVIHQFTLRMLPDRENIIRARGLETVLHADGYSNAQAKIQVYRDLGFPVPPFHAGFKLFFREDVGLMSPEQVMALRPQPDIVTYQ